MTGLAVIALASSEMNTLARLVIQRAQPQWRELDAHIAWCDEGIAQHARDNPWVRTAFKLRGIGPLTASATAATVDDFAQFKNGSQFGACCGITPGQDSSGGKTKLGRITFYFATPYHSWERGTDENTNGLIRQYLPKGMCMRHIDQADCARIAAALNNRPRLRLGFKTPSETLFARPGGVALQS